jgi:hypothetical protein
MTAIILCTSVFLTAILHIICGHISDERYLIVLISVLDDSIRMDTIGVFDESNSRPKRVA